MRDDDVHDDGRRHHHFESAAAANNNSSNNTNNASMLVRGAFEARARRLHADVEREKRERALLERDFEKATRIARGLKRTLDDVVEAKEKQSRELESTKEEAREHVGRIHALEMEMGRLESMVKDAQAERNSVKDEAERRIRQLTIEQSTSEVNLELQRERELRRKETQRAERAERALDDAAVAFSGERRDADDEMRRHIERRLEMENEKEKCLNLMEEMKMKLEKERRERDTERTKLQRANEQLTNENEKRKEQTNNLEEECRKANAALRERSADMALAVKKLNVELKQQRLETEKGMAKRVEALRVAFGNAIEEVKEEARVSLQNKEEESVKMQQKEEELNARMTLVEKHCLKARDAILELTNEKESLEEERDELRRALQRAGEMNAQLTKRAMDSISGTTGGFSKEDLAKQNKKRAAFTKITSNVRHPQNNKGPKQLAETLVKELEQLKATHEKSIKALTTNENGKNDDLEKMVERIDEISRKIEAKATQVSLAVKST